MYVYLNVLVFNNVCMLLTLGLPDWTEMTWNKNKLNTI